MFMPKEEVRPVTNCSELRAPASWKAIANSVEPMYDIGEYITEYPEEGVIRWAIAPDKRSADYLVSRLDAIETIRGWIFDPNEQEEDTQDPAQLIRKIGELLTWYEDEPKVQR